MFGGSLASQHQGLPQRCKLSHSFEQRSFPPLPSGLCLHSVPCQQWARQRSDGSLWVAFLSNYSEKTSSQWPSGDSLKPHIIYSRGSQRDCTLEPPGALSKHAGAQTRSQTPKSESLGQGPGHLHFVKAPQAILECNHNRNCKSDIQLIYRICPYYRLGFLAEKLHTIHTHTSNHKEEGLEGIANF